MIQAETKAESQNKTKRDSDSFSDGFKAGVGSSALGGKDLINKPSPGFLASSLIQEPLSPVLTLRVHYQKSPLCPTLGVTFGFERNDLSTTTFT